MNEQCYRALTRPRKFSAAQVPSTTAYSFCVLWQMLSSHTHGGPSAAVTCKCAACEMTRLT